MFGFFEPKWAEYLPISSFDLEGFARFAYDIGISLCGRDGMVDIPDLKSEGQMPVGVRVPPPAPFVFKVSVSEPEHRPHLYR